MVIVRNIHIDIIRERKNKMLRTIDIDDIRQPLTEPKLELTSNKIFIEEELIKLRIILKMYYRSQPKIELCLKIKFRIPVSTEDIIRCFPDCPQHDIDKLTQDFRFKQDRQVFETIIDIFNRNEGKENKGDTLRKWIAMKTDEIIQHLNHTYDYQVYNQKNISDLITLYFQDMNTIKGDQKWM